ncbi:MAG: alpha/beta fold hydrolase [Erythrobacter sp.]|uniref:alpha/beta hydrolase n=1 Tax=Erythrobacter sp. TaxID=1042 RepID=UPI001B1EA9F7|nr:alpha/beta fold hydrolase [Erythrobacter sp.]MBO6768889.1 alpha/beta fold hydrolase [Erythrobacter sp.]
MTTALATFAVAYLALVAVLYLAQGSLIYPAPRGILPITGGFEEVSYTTADGLDLKAGYRAARPGFPTIVYFHGNGADWVSSVVATDRLVPEGYGVLAAEYRGYRGNPGSPSEEGLYRDGRAAIAFLAERGVDPGNLVLIGNSIGSGVAVQMASEIAPAALVLISPFASLSQLAAEKFRWLPTGLLLRDRYENMQKIGEIGAPTLILHGDADSVVPHIHAERLLAANPDAYLRIFSGYGHDLAWHDAAEEAVIAFLAQQTEEDHRE